MNDLILSIYEDFGFSDVTIKFSDRPEKRIGEDAVWDKAEAALMAALKTSARPWSLNKGEGAFYGPKLEYVLARRHRPRLAVRHRAGRPQHARPAGRVLHRRALEQGHSRHAPPRHVRLARALHRHSDRALWRAPPLVALAAAGRGRHHHRRGRRLCPRGDRRGAARRPAGRGRPAQTRKINYKVREHSLAKVPALLVVGRKEGAERTVSIRRLGKEGQTVLPLDAALAALADEAVPPDVRRMKQAA